MKTKKDYERILRKIKSLNGDIVIKYSKLRDAYIEYLKSPYRENAIKQIETFITKKFMTQQEQPPHELHRLFLETAKYYIENGRYEEAIKILDTISDSRSMDILISIDELRNLITLKQSLENGKIDEEALGKLSDIVATDVDENGVLETTEEGKLTSYDIATTYFADLPVEMLSSEIFPSDMVQPGTKPRVNSDSVPHPNLDPEDTKYIEELSAEKRLEFIRQHFNIEKVRIGENKFAGTVLFEIADSDLVIAESFFETGRNGECIETYGKATYILPKDTELDLIMLSRGELMEKSKETPQISRVIHRSTEWYDKLAEQFEIVKNLSNIKNEVQEPENTHGESEQNTNGNVEEVFDDKKYKFRTENEEFINQINENIDNSLNSTMIEGLLEKANYSFKNVYEKKLKDKIIERLKILEKPEETVGLEAQKVFLYIRMTQNLSMINNYMITGKQLDNILDDAVLQYEDAIGFFMNHKDDGLSYKDMRKGMIQFLRTRIDTLSSIEQPNQAVQSNGGEIYDVHIEKNQEEISEIDNSQSRDDTYIEEEPQIDILTGEREGSKQQGAKLDIGVRLAELLQRNAELQRKLDVANRILEEKRAAYNVAVQATLEARTREEEAKEAMMGAQGDVDQLTEESGNIQDILSQIDDLLK